MYKEKQDIFVSIKLIYKGKENRMYNFFFSLRNTCIRKKEKLFFILLVFILPIKYEGQTKRGILCQDRHSIQEKTPHWFRYTLICRDVYWWLQTWNKSLTRAPSLTVRVPHVRTYYSLFKPVSWLKTDIENLGNNWAEPNILVHQIHFWPALINLFLSSGSNEKWAQGSWN